jgi:transposase
MTVSLVNTAAPVPPACWSTWPSSSLTIQLAHRARGANSILLDNLGIHTPKGSRLLRALLAELGEDLVLVYTPTCDPDANRIEWLWRALRRTVTHTHQRQRLQDLVADADRWAHAITPAQVLSQIGSPFAPDQQPTAGEELNHAA